MATILIKRNDVSGSIPTPGELQDGELALNTVDGGLYYLNSGSGAVALVRTSGSVAVSSSYALTASFAANAGGTPATASYAVTSSYAATTSPIISSSYALTSSYAATTAPIVSSSYALSASWAPGTGAVSASYATTSSYAVTSSFSTSASWAPGGSSVSASYALTSSYAALAQNVLGSITSASYALTSSYAVSASWAPGSTSTSASYALTASYAANAAAASVTASYLAGGNAPAAYNAGSIYVSGSVTASMDVQANRFLTFGGNLGAGLPSTFPNVGLGLMGWNRSSGGGEVDFYAFRGAGGTGGFRFYDYNAGERLVLTIDTNGNLTATSFNGNLAGGTLSASTSGISGLLTLTGGGANTMFLNGVSQNWIRWSTAGFAPPAFTTPSSGMKLLLYPALASNAVDYSIGIDSNTIWFAVPQLGPMFFRWYGGTAKIAEIHDTGSLWLSGSLTSSAISASGQIIALSFTGSVGSASYAVTSSYAATALTASYAVTSSYSVTQSVNYVTSSLVSITSASWASSSISSSYASFAPGIQRVAFNTQNMVLQTITCYPISTPISMSAGQSVHMKWSLNRGNPPANIGIALSADSGSTGYWFVAQGDGNLVNYNFNSGSLSAINSSGAGVESTVGANVLDFTVCINAQTSSLAGTISTTTKQTAWPAMTVQKIHNLAKNPLWIYIAPGDISASNAMNVEVL